MRSGVSWNKFIERRVSQLVMSRGPRSCWPWPRVKAIKPRHGGGPQTIYGLAERQRILQEARRTPDRERDGTATWSLSTLQRALRQAPDGLPNVSTYTIWVVLHEAGVSWQKTRSWSETGKVKRKRKAGMVEVTDPDTTVK